MSLFPTDYQAILERIDSFDPIAYAKTRNYANGAVSQLSPYISRGVISTRVVYERLLKKGFKLYQMEKFVQELAWRDFWQKQWQYHGEAINQDLKHTQEKVKYHGLPKALIEGNTGIEAIDNAIKELYHSGYMHNHLRMYVASIACNVAQYHWHKPAQWMFAHLLDGDWASNALSWQWVAGANSNKKYWANQDNMNHFCHTDQWKTFLDFSYDDLPHQEVPRILTESVSEPTSKDQTNMAHLSPTGLPNWDVDYNAICLYTPYNLDPLWRNDLKAHRILLLDPEYFTQYPISNKVFKFIKDLAIENIPELQIFVGSFNALKRHFAHKEFYAKEHPALSYPVDVLDSRDWLSPDTPYKPSFFPYWKSCHKTLKQELNTVKPQ